MTTPTTENECEELLKKVMSGAAKLEDQLEENNPNSVFLIRDLLSYIKRDTSLDLSDLSIKIFPPLLAKIIEFISLRYLNYEYKKKVEAYALVLNDIFETIVKKGGEKTLEQTLRLLPPKSLLKLPPHILCTPLGNMVDPEILRMILGHIELIHVNTAENKVAATKNIKGSINEAFRRLVDVWLAAGTIAPELISKYASGVGTISNLTSSGAGGEIGDLLKISEDAALRKIKKIFKVLFTNGADVNVPDKDGQTALMRAVEKGNIELVDLLIKNNANINAQNTNNGQTALMLAVKNWNTNVVRLLLEGGAKLDIVDINGKNADFYNYQGIGKEKSWNEEIKGLLSGKQLALREKEEGQKPHKGSAPSLLKPH